MWICFTAIFSHFFLKKNHFSRYNTYIVYKNSGCWQQGKYKIMVRTIDSSITGPLFQCLIFGPRMISGILHFIPFSVLFSKEAASILMVIFLCVYVVLFVRSLYFCPYLPDSVNWIASEEDSPNHIHHNRTAILWSELGWK